MKPCACSETNNTAMAVAAWRSANWARHGVRQTFGNFTAASLAGSSIGSGNRLRRLSTNASERCLDTRSILVSEHVAHLETSSAVAWINRERVGHARHSAGVVNGRRWGTAIPTVNMLNQTLEARHGCASEVVALCAASNAVCQQACIEQLQHQAAGAVCSGSSLLNQGYYIDPVS